MAATAQDFTILPISRINQSFLNFNTKYSFKKTKRVLLIEDDEDMCKSVSRNLKKNYNCIVDIANDPFEAVNFILDKFYDLIILDWNLPGLSGAETLLEAEKGLRLEPGISNQWDNCRVPVVVFTSLEKKQFKVRKTKHFKCAGYISKQQPFNTIINQVIDHLEDAKIVSPVVSLFNMPVNALKT